MSQHDDQEIASVVRESADTKRRFESLDEKVRHLAGDLNELGNLLHESNLVTAVRLNGRPCLVVRRSDGAEVEIDVQAVSLDQITAVLQELIGVREQFRGLRERRRAGDRRGCLSRKLCYTVPRPCVGAPRGRGSRHAATWGL